MIEVVIATIADTLSKKWDGRYEVYTESVGQGVEKPCFFVDCEKTEVLRLLGNRFLLRATVRLCFDNDGEEKKYESEKIAPEVFALMSTVKCGEEVFHGRKMTGTWEDGCFVMRACYDFELEQSHEQEKAELMETIERYVDGSGEVYEGGAVTL